MLAGVAAFTLFFWKADKVLDTCDCLDKENRRKMTGYWVCLASCGFILFGGLFGLCFPSEDHKPPEMLAGEKARDLPGVRRARNGGPSIDDDDFLDETYAEEDPATPLKAEMELREMRERGSEEYAGREAFADQSNKPRRARTYGDRMREKDPSYAERYRDPDESPAEAAPPQPRRATAKVSPSPSGSSPSPGMPASEDAANEEILALRARLAQLSEQFGVDTTEDHEKQLR